MRIFAKKKFMFRQGDQSFMVDPLVFTSAPDWIKKDPMFKWAQVDGDIEVLDSKEDEKAVETAIETGKTKEDKKVKTPGN